MLNPDSFIHTMNCCDSPWLSAIWAFCFAEDTFLCQQNLIADFVIIVDLLAIYVCRVKIGLTLPVSPTLFQLAMNGMLKSMLHPIIAAPGEALSTV